MENNKDLIKEEERLEKEKINAMSPEEKKAYLAEKKAKQKAEAAEKYANWEKEHAEKVAAKKAELQEKGKSLFWFNIGQSAFCQWFVKTWNKFDCFHPALAKLVYQIGFFFIFSNGVTIWQYLVMLFLPHLFGAELAAVSFQWPAIDLNGFYEFKTATGEMSSMYGIVFNEVPLWNKAGTEIIIGGGLGNFLAFEIAVFTAQCINFPLQRNITFKSDGNPVIQAIWYFIGWVAISILVNMVWGVCNVFMMKWNIDPAISNLLKTFITGGLSMFVFFFIFKIIFPEKKEEAK